MIIKSKANFCQKCGKPLVEKKYVYLEFFDRDNGEKTTVYRYLKNCPSIKFFTHGHDSFHFEENGEETWRSSYRRVY